MAGTIRYTGRFFAYAKALALAGTLNADPSDTWEYRVEPHGAGSLYRVGCYDPDDGFVDFL